MHIHELLRLRKNLALRAEVARIKEVVKQLLKSNKSESESLYDQFISEELSENPLFETYRKKISDGKFDIDEQERNLKA